MKRKRHDKEAKAFAVGYGHGQLDLIKGMLLGKRDPTDYPFAPLGGKATDLFACWCLAHNINQAAQLDRAMTMGRVLSESYSVRYI